MTSKLTRKERAWIDEVNEVLARCPSPEKSVFTLSVIHLLACTTCATTGKYRTKTAI